MTSQDHDATTTKPESGSHRTVTHLEWVAEGEALYGKDLNLWKFVCPSCGHVASVRMWRDLGASDGQIAFSCIGRLAGANGSKAFKRQGGPCNYAGGGFIGLNPVTVTFKDGSEPMKVFAFAGREEVPRV